MYWRGILAVCTEYRLYGKYPLSVGTAGAWQERDRAELVTLQ
jgi:hypothetical protein